MSAITRFGFHRIVVRDLHKQAAFYKAAFGYAEMQTIRAEVKGRPLEEIILAGPAGKVEMILLTFHDGQSEPSPSGTLPGFYTSDLEVLGASIVAAGGSVYQEITPLQLPTGPSRMAFYTDPEGFIFEVIEA